MTAALRGSMPRRPLRALFVFLAVVCAGCASRAPLLVSHVDPAGPRTVELAATPFFPQERYQCGPAALATVLGASGIPVSAHELTSKVYLPDRRGSLQTELLGATRTYDRLAYPIDPDLAAIAAELAAGRPVLVLQNLAFVRVPVWHYAVVIGFDAQTDTLVLRSGTTERLVVSAERFLKRWDRADRWALVLVKPGSFPTRPDRDRYLLAAAGLEAAGRYEAALQAYDAAVAKWPDSTTALLGIGNVHYRRKALEEAAQAYRHLLEADPGHAVARNNLAQVLLEQGNPETALREITIARAQLADPRFADMLQATEDQIRRALPSRD